MIARLVFVAIAAFSSTAFGQTGMTLRSLDGPQPNGGLGNRNLLQLQNDSFPGPPSLDPLRLFGTGNTTTPPVIDLETLLNPRPLLARPRLPMPTDGGYGINFGPGSDLILAPPSTRPKPCCLSHMPAGPDYGPNEPGTGQKVPDGNRLVVATWPPSASECLPVAQRIIDALEAAPRNLNRRGYPRAPEAQPYEPIFRQKCFSRASGKSISSSDVSRSVGILEVDGAAYCSAIVIDAKTLLTAKHCFYSKHNGEADIALRRTEVRFRLFANIDKAISLATKQTDPRWKSTNSEIVDVDDYLFVDLASPLDNAIALPFTVPQPGQGLEIVGPYSYSASDSIAASLLWSAPENCRIKAVDDACVYHGCQTTPGYSGAAILTKDVNGKISIIGMHIGATSKALSCPRAELATSISGNVGIRIPGRN